MNRLVVSGVMALHDDQARERQRHVEPHQRGERRRGHQPGRRHLQHQHEIEPRHALVEAEQRETACRATAGTTTITQTVAAAISPGRVKWWRKVGRIDAQKGEQQHHEDGFAEIGLDGGGERRHRQAEEDRGRRQQRAVAAEPRRARPRAARSNFIAGQTPAARWRQALIAPSPIGNPYMKTLPHRLER